MLIAVLKSLFLLLFTQVLAHPTGVPIAFYPITYQRILRRRAHRGSSHRTHELVLHFVWLDHPHADKQTTPRTNIHGLLRVGVTAGGVRNSLIKVEIEICLRVLLSYHDHSSKKFKTDPMQGVQKTCDTLNVFVPYQHHHHKNTAHAYRSSKRVQYQ